MEKESLRRVRFILPALLLLPGGCGRKDAGPVRGLPGGDLLERLPASSLAALSLAGGGPPPVPARLALERMGFLSSEIDILSRSKGWAAALTPKGKTALLAKPQGPVQGFSPLPGEGDLFFFSRPRGLLPGGPALGSKQAWQVLARAALSWKGKLLFWVSLAGLLDSGNALFGGKKPENLPGGAFLFSGKARELLNTDAFEAALFRVEREGRGRFGVFLWPDRVGLSGVLLPGKGGISGGLPPGKETVLAWRIRPRGLASILVGLESLQGALGRLAATGLSLFRARIGLDPGRDILPALGGTLFLEARPGGGILVLGLRPGPAADRLCRVLSEKKSALAGVLGMVLRKTVEVLYVKGKFLFLLWGKGPAGHVSPPRADPSSRRLGYFRLPLPAKTGGGPKFLEGEFLRAPYGMEGSFRLRN